jgi:hypothetical protein
MSKYLFVFVMSFLMAISVKSVSNAQTDPAAVKDSTAKTTTAEAPISGVTIPAGTKFVVNINTAISTAKNVAGSSFTTILDADFVFDGKVISPKGSQVIGKIVEAKSGGGLGEAKLSFQFTDITVNKQLTPIVTDPIEVKGGRGRKDQVEIAAGTLEEVPLKAALVIK